MRKEEHVEKCRIFPSFSNLCFHHILPLLNFNPHEVSLTSSVMHISKIISVAQVLQSKKNYNILNTSTTY
uniref:Uncharacterized protein n=1 Tax=Populus trichocarpa TaxID=3694 RepID=A0A2K2ATY6_POPTR